MRRTAHAAHFAPIGIASVFAATLSAVAAVCPEGEATFKNSVFYTCTCYTGSNGQKTCFWKAD